MAGGPEERPRASASLQAASAFFVLSWSTGFIGARWGLPYADPLTFLAVRFATVIPILAAIGVVAGAPWPRDWTQIGHNIVVGISLHGIYLGGVFIAISRGMPVGLSALVVGLMPVIAALAAGPLLGERVSRVQWTGIAMGFAGLVMVVHDKTGVSGASAWAWDWVAMALVVAALLGLSFGNLYQKRFGGTHDIRTATIWQFIGALVFVAVLAFVLEDIRLEWTIGFTGALAWLVLVQSVAGIYVLMYIIRHGEISRVAALYYLTPPITAVLGYLLFGEAMSFIEIIGIAITALGVALVTHKSA